MNNNYKYGMMEGYHGDEHIQDESVTHKVIGELNVEDLMGIDHEVWLKKTDKGFKLEIENSEDQVTFTGDAIHPYAIESMAAFCRRFLFFYDNTSD
jgi:hypothetical protein